MEEKLEEFEEIEETPAKEARKGTEEGPQFGSGERPDFRVVQTDRDRDGKSVYVNVGGMWKRTSKNGNDFYVLRIGRLKLLVFQNDKERQGGFEKQPSY
ncbi:MAG: hypothetical protein QXH30_01450 [Candidatus Bilamarchaeaceae archaeon]